MADFLYMLSIIVLTGVVIVAVRRRGPKWLADRYTYKEERVIRAATEELHRHPYKWDTPDESANGSNDAAGTPERL